MEFSAPKLQCRRSKFNQAGFWTNRNARAITGTFSSFKGILKTLKIVKSLRTRPKTKSAAVYRKGLPCYDGMIRQTEAFHAQPLS